MSGYNVYGLRAARKILKEMRAVLRGRTSDYVRGSRAALFEADRLIAIEIKRIQSEVSATHGKGADG